jgi:hypothetical protein
VLFSVNVFIISPHACSEYCDCLGKEVPVLGELPNPGIYLTSSVHGVSLFSDFLTSLFTYEYTMN